MTHTPDIQRPDRHLVEALRDIGTALPSQANCAISASAMLRSPGRAP